MKRNLKDIEVKNIIVIPTVNEYNYLFEYQLIEYNSILKYALSDDLLVVISGIGKINTAITITYLLNLNIRFNKILLAGIAGAYKDTGLKVGDVVSIKEDYFVDEALFHNNTIKMTNEINFPVCKDNKTTFLIFNSLKVVNANTVSLISGDDKLSELYHKKTNASIESMEGAAFGLVCKKFNVNAYQIRAISNYCGNREKQMWDVKKALKNLKEVLYSLHLVKH
ncbi:hypothetical protein OWM07_07365 [Deferribacter thermophilus]|uniref:phosphorylase family protein n=1 Tax=Deferribacter thermophilus TaxID=53573 RepID=UPI003C259525